MNSIKKTILIYNSVSYFIPLFQEKGIPAFRMHREISTIARVLRKISYKLNFCKPLWYGAWKNLISSADEVIIFCIKYNDYESVVKYIRKINPKIRIIFWYWNPVAGRKNPLKISDDICEKWSFDKDDCLKYNLKYNTTFYFDNITLPQNDHIYDVIFLGANKGRKAALENLQNKMNDNNISTYFHIVDKSILDNNNNVIYPPLDYSDYLELISKSRAILDYVQEGQNGLTLRPMESIFFRKKLITNDRSIRTNDFYHPNNIFIIGIDKFENLEEFIKTPYTSLSSNIVEKYDVMKWIERFSEPGNSQFN